MADIVKHCHDFLHAGVRFAIADPIINMLCRYFQYRVTLDESDYTPSGYALNTSLTIYDYVCWGLMFKKEDHYIPVHVVVLETKHQLNLKTAAQAIGYYSRAKTINSTGIALLVNELDGYVSFRIVLFPYQKKNNFGAQAILLPSTRYSYDDFVASGSVIKLICTICGVLILDKSKPFTVTLPGGLEVVDAENLIGVYSEQVLKELQLRKLEEQNEHKKEELRKLEEQNEHKKSRKLESLKIEELQKQEELELQGPANKRSKQS